jgi:hypothetical protein
MKFIELREKLGDTDNKKIKKCRVDGMEPMEVIDGAY